MDRQEFLKQEAEYVKVIGQLEEQEAWAKVHGHKLLAEAYSEGSRALLGKLGFLQMIYKKDQEFQKREMTDFCSKVIALKEKGFFVEDMCNVYGPQFDGQYRWMNSKTGDFQDSDVSYTEVEAWVTCIKANG